MYKVYDDYDNKGKVLDKTEFMDSIDETMDTFLADMRQMMVIKKIFGQR